MPKVTKTEKDYDRTLDRINYLIVIKGKRPFRRNGPTEGH